MTSATLWRIKTMTPATLWRIVALTVAVLFLIMFWQSTENGRYVFHGPYVIDSRTGVVTKAVVK